MNIFVYEYAYFVPFGTFTDKQNRGGGGLLRKDYPLLLRGKTRNVELITPLINDVKRERGNPPPFRPNYII